MENVMEVKLSEEVIKGIAKSVAEATTDRYFRYAFSVGIDVLAGVAVYKNIIEPIYYGVRYMIRDKKAAKAGLCAVELEESDHQDEDDSNETD